MILFIVIAFVGFIAGSFTIFNITPFELIESIMKFFQERKIPIVKQIEAIKNPKDAKGIRRTVNEAKEVLRLMGKEEKFRIICVISFFLMVVGLFVSVIMENILMIPVAMIGMALIPFWYLIFTSHSYKKQMDAEIETALSIITTSYLRNESIITAVEENISYLNPPISNIFQSFLNQSKMINVNTKQALADMKFKLDHYVFHEWLDVMIACQEDKTLKTTVTPIITKLSDMRIVTAELDYLMYEPLKEFITMAILLVVNIPLIYFLNKEWFKVLTDTIFGKGILAICVASILISFAAVIRLTKPIDYKR